MTPPTAVIAVWPPSHVLVAFHVVERPAPATPAMPPAAAPPVLERYAAPAVPSRSGARRADRPELTSVSSR